MVDPSRPSAEDLPEQFGELVDADEQSVATLYNDLQGMDSDAFAAAFEDSLATLKRVADVDEPELAAVLGVDRDEDGVVDATVLSVHVVEDERVVHVAATETVPDAVIYVPVRPHDFPPGSNEPLERLDVEGYREIVASMVFVRHGLIEDDTGRYDDLYLEPLLVGLEAYVGGSGDD